MFKNGFGYSISLSVSLSLSTHTQTYTNKHTRVHHLRYALSPSKDLQENRIFRTDRYLVSELNYHKNMSRVSTHARELFRHTHTGSPTRVGIESRVWTQLGDGEQYVSHIRLLIMIYNISTPTHSHHKQQICSWHRSTTQHRRCCISKFLHCSYPSSWGWWS